MTSVQPVPRYEDNLWYPILVKFPGCGFHHIIEMQGRKVNEWNDMVRQQAVAENYSVRDN